MFDDDHTDHRQLDIGLIRDRRATLVTARDGGPIRTLINGSAVHPTGVYRSSKARRPQPWKSLGELARFQVCEVDPSVRSYLAQPHRIDFHLPGKVVPFFADLRIERVDGTVDIELSPPSKTVPKGEVIGWARAVYAALGWRFRQRTASERKASRLLEENCLRFEGDRFTVVPPEALLASRTLVRTTNGQVSYRDLADHLGTVLGNVPRGRAVVHAMIVQGHVEIDLNKPLRPGTPLRVRPRPDGRRQ